MEPGHPALGVHPHRGLSTAGTTERRQPLTAAAHAAWRAFLQPGAWALDATCGNGHDTLFLARAVAPDGRVYAVDIQEAAIRATARRLQQAGLADAVALIPGDHALLSGLLPAAARGRIRLACFNLGYLPGGDHTLTTRAETTGAALRAALEFMHPHGALSVIAYRGHAGAQEEAAAAAAFFAALPAPWRIVVHEPTGSADNPGPVWWLAAAG